VVAAKINSINLVEAKVNGGDAVNSVTYFSVIKKQRTYSAKIKKPE
jgi:hypothetical protein